MPSKKFNSLDEFESSVTEKIGSWSNDKRTVLTAAMADRWLPVYDAFSDKNDFGNVAIFQDAVETVWNCVLNHRQLSDEAMKQQQKRMEKDTPAVDYFDCEDALATIGIIEYALYCCRKNDNTTFAARAMAYGLAGVAPILFEDPDDAPPDVLHGPEVRNEIEKQFKLIEVIGNMASIDQQTIDALRKQLASPDLTGPVAPRPKSPGGPTNKAIFERYRKSTESDTKKVQSKNDPLGSQPTFVFSMWGGRYLRRKYMIEKLSDVAAREALVIRNTTHDAAVEGDPGWDSMTRFMITGSYPHPEAGYDVTSPQHPHGYGPSFRRLCIEGGAAGAWQWAHHVPSSWEEEDRRKEEGLGKLLTRALSWHATNDVDYPWATEVDGQTWRVRLNDFPDEVMYSLIVGDDVVGNFHDWPKSWNR